METSRLLRLPDLRRIFLYFLPFIFFPWNTIEFIFLSSGPGLIGRAQGRREK